MIDPFDLSYLLGALKRRWWVIVLPLAVGGALSVGIAFLLPPVYSSSARIVVEAQQIPTDLARSTVATDAAQRIRLIEERVTTRRNLLDLAQRYDVFPRRPDLSATDVASRMKAAIQIRPVSTSNRRGARADTAITTVEISFRASRAATAAQVANELLTQVLAQNAEQRSARASETLDFFTREVERLSAELRAIEARIAVYRTENQASLPEGIEFRRSEVAALRRAIDAGDARRLSLEDTRRVVEAALAAGRPAGPVALSAEQAELERLRTTLAQQQAIYAPSHPSIRNLNARIASLETAVASVEASPASGAEASIAPELQRIEAEIALIDSQREAGERRIAELEAAIARVGEVGIGLGALERDLANLQVQYQQAVLKRAEAATGERLEINQQAERFEVIEQPQTPEQPISPNRPLIAAAGAVLSLGLGLGLAALLELLKPAVRAARDVERLLEMKPIVTIPYISTRVEISRRRWTLRLALFLVAIVLPATLWYVDQQVIPLSALAERLVAQLGLTEALQILQNRLNL